MIENHHSSNDMARCLASYMDCPQRIYDEVIAEWSASPCVTTIREYIARHQRNKLRDDARDYDPGIPTRDEKHLIAMEIASADLKARIEASRRVG